MPKVWIYFLALLLPLALHTLVLETRFFLDWLWYSGYQAEYHFLNGLSNSETMQELVGGWPLPVFVLTMLFFWIDRREEGDNIGGQFLLLPVVYALFVVIGKGIVSRSFDAETIYTYPIAIIAGGYLYILPWVLFVWVFSKLRLIVD